MSKPPSKFHFTQHARKRSAERIITEHDFKNAILLPGSKRKQSNQRAPHGGFLFIFTKKVNGRELEVVAEIFKDECFVVTGYWK